MTRGGWLCLLLLLGSPGSFADEPVPPAAVPRAAAARVVELRHDEGGALSVLLDRGGQHGLVKGDRFVLLREERPVATVELIVVFDAVSSARVVSKSAAPKVGDHAVRVDGNVVEGQVLTLDRDMAGVVTVSLGRKHGLKLGEALRVLRGGRRFAELKVFELAPGRCRARVVSYMIDPRGVGAMRPRVGDLVRPGPQPLKLAPAYDADAERARARALRLQAQRLDREAARLRREAATLESDLRRRAARGEVLARLARELGAELEWRGAEQRRGALVLIVAAGGVAARSGLRSGDLIERVSGRRPADLSGLAAALAPLRRGESVEVELWRGRSVERLRLSPTAPKEP